MSIKNGKMTKPTPQRECLECGVKFLVTRPWKCYCSPKCQWRRWDKDHPRQKGVSV